MSDNQIMTDTLDCIENETDSDPITIGQIIHVIEHRGFGPLLIAPALLTVLPTGAVPGVPAFCGIIIILISVQLLVGKKRPWIPKRLEHFSLKREQYKYAAHRAKPYTKKIDRLFKARLRFLTNGFMHHIIAFLTIILSIITIVLGFIPFFAMLPGCAILLFGVGLTARDGLFTILGMAFFSVTLMLVPYLIITKGMI